MPSDYQLSYLKEIVRFASEQTPLTPGMDNQLKPGLVMKQTATLFGKDFKLKVGSMMRFNGNSSRNKSRLSKSTIVDAFTENPPPAVTGWPEKTLTYSATHLRDCGENISKHTVGNITNPFASLVLK